MRNEGLPTIQGRSRNILGSVKKQSDSHFVVDETQDVSGFNPAAVGKRIAQARREAGGMTQETLAGLLGISVRAVSSYETGVKIPWKYLHEIGHITNKSAAWLLRGDSEVVEATAAQSLADRLDRLESEQVERDQALANHRLRLEAEIRALETQVADGFHQSAETLATILQLLGRVPGAVKRPPTKAAATKGRRRTQAQA